MANLTLLDIAKLNAGDEVVGLIEESISVNPELKFGTGRTIAGTGFDSLVRTNLPSVGFRSLNEGVATSKCTYVTRRSNCYLVDAGSEIDAAAGQAIDDGIEGALAMELAGKTEAAMRSLASQFYYGQATTIATSTAASPTKGFPGLVELYDTVNCEVDAGGAGGTRSSVWLLKFGPQYIQWLYGKGGQFDVGETQLVRLTDGSSNPYDGYRKTLTFWVGLHCTNPRHAAVRIKGLTAATPLTDAQLNQALAKFAPGISPDLIVMNLRSLQQLQASRTATTATGAPAPWPTGIVGIAGGNIPIYVTDAIVITEAA